MAVYSSVLFKFLFKFYLSAEGSSEGEELKKLAQSPLPFLFCLEDNKIQFWALTGRLEGGMEIMLCEGLIKIWIPP